MKLLSVQFEKSVAHIDQLPKNRLPEIAFAGRSNVGKSSLINCLLNRKQLAKTSSTPGKTRLLNFFLINNNLYFIDLPGYGFAKVSLAQKQKWQKLIEAYFQTSQMLKGVIVITDIRHPVMQSDLEIIRWITHLEIPVIIIGTKADKLSNTKLSAQLAHNHQQLQEILPAAEILPFSAVTHLGKKQVWNKIDHLVRT